MSEATIKFGTDGWRGEIANDYTFGNVRRCAQVLRVVSRLGSRKLTP
jgi:phosphomannomutase